MLSKLLPRFKILFMRTNVIHSLVPRPRPSTRERGSGNFSRFSWHFVRFKSCDTCLCACAFQQQAHDPRTAHCVVPRGRGLGAVTREFECDNCVTNEILQSDWTIPNRAGVPRKSTKVPRPSFVRESREGLGPRLCNTYVCICKYVHCSPNMKIFCQRAQKF